MKTSELQGAELDFWVGKALGGQVETFYSGMDEERKPFDRFVPTRNFPKLTNYGLSFSRLNMDPKSMDGHDYSFHPSTDWSQGGPLIEKYDISIWNNSDDRCGKYKAHVGPINGTYLEMADERDWGFGPTPLIAACRAIVASVYGDEVE